jgi:hypothetical protein
VPPPLETQAFSEPHLLPSSFRRSHCF